MQGVSASEQLRELEAFATTELNQAQRDLSELGLLIRQTAGEVERLTSRSSQAMARQREAESNLDGFSRQDLRQIFTTAADSQKRLLMMQTQAEQLESRQMSLNKYVEALQKTLAVVGSLSGATEMGFPLSANPTIASPAPALSSGQLVMSRMIEAQEDERNRVARQIHDGPLQALTNVVLRAEICERLVGRDPAQALEELGQIKDLIASTLRDTRRFIFDLRPMILDDLGLLPTVRKYLEAFRQKSSFTVAFTAGGQERRLEPHLEIAVFRLIQEALQNVARHAQASEAKVLLEMEGQQVSVVVEDDGVGFDVGAALAGAREERGRRFGIGGMLERVEALGGRLSIESSPGHGARLVAILPTGG